MINFGKYRHVYQWFFLFLILAFILFSIQKRKPEDDEDDDDDNDNKKKYFNLCKQIAKIFAMNLAALAVLGGAGVGIGYAIQAACKIN